MTHGFPSMTAFLGLMWALERKAYQAGLEACFNAIGVVTHRHQELVTEGGFVKTFRLTRNPVDQTGKPAAIVEEGRLHMEISLVFGVVAEHWRDPETEEKEVRAIGELLNAMRVAGGTIQPPEEPGLHRYRPWTLPQTGSDASQVFRKARGRLLPGWTLVLRDDLLDRRLETMRVLDSDSNRLDAWLSLSRVNWYWSEDQSDGGGWRRDRTRGSGWIVPIPAGYAALSATCPPGSVANARDSETPFRFVESVYSVGEWIGPHRLTDARQMLWYSRTDEQTGLYLCGNDYVAYSGPTEQSPTILL